MVLIRLAHTADLPSPDELIRMLGGEGALVRSGKPAPSGDAPGRNAPLNSAAPAERTAPMSPAASTAPIPFEPAAFEAAPLENDASESDNGGFDADYEASLDELAGGAPAFASADPRSFEDVIAIAGERRDMMLKVHLEDRVSLVKFDAAAGSIDLFLLPGAPSHIANELREKLNAWTGRKWVVVLSKAPGDRPRGEMRREREAAELEALRSHPGRHRQGDPRPVPRRKDCRYSPAARSAPRRDGHRLRQ
ncbi:MAG: hypothetical protein WDN31_07320 [Hyphomicrobium sp.]